MYLLLGTQGCHLCEQASALLADVLKSASIRVIETDIAEHSRWQAGYAVRIPVFYHVETGRDLGWPFTRTELLNFINESNDD